MRSYQSVQKKASHKIWHPFMMKLSVNQKQRNIFLSWQRAFTRDLQLTSYLMFLHKIETKMRISTPNPSVQHSVTRSSSRNNKASKRNKRNEGEIKSVAIRRWYDHINGKPWRTCERKHSGRHKWVLYGCRIQDQPLITCDKMT